MRDYKEYQKVLDERFRKEMAPCDISVVAAARRHKLDEVDLHQDVNAILAMELEGERKHTAFLVRYARRFYEKGIP